jgi:hypothetical protein
MAKEKERAVMVTTAKRGVFFGYTSEDAMVIVGRGSVTLRRARMCTYWSQETHGVLGLAGIGPQKGSKIGPQVPDLACNEVTSIVGCTPKAVEAWEAEPWK